VRRGTVSVAILPIPGPLPQLWGRGGASPLSIIGEGVGGEEEIGYLSEPFLHFLTWRSDMEMFWYDLKPLAMLSTVIYSVIGLVVFALSLFIMSKVTPFSIAKEIGEDQNTALAIIIGSVFISLAIIIQAAIRG
jgi:putative membrane protein